MCPRDGNHGPLYRETLDPTGTEWVCRSCGHRVFLDLAAGAAAIATGPDRASRMDRGQYHAWIRRLVDDGFTDPAIAGMVNRSTEEVADLTAKIRAKGKGLAKAYQGDS